MWNQELLSETHYCSIFKQNFGKLIQAILTDLNQHRCGIVFIHQYISNNSRICQNLSVCRYQHMKTCIETYALVIKPCLGYL